MKLTKYDQEIAELEERINSRFHRSYLKKLKQMKDKLSKYKIQQIYKEVSKESVH